MHPYETNKTVYLAPPGELEKPSHFTRPSDEAIEEECKYEMIKFYKESFEIGVWASRKFRSVFISNFYWRWIICIAVPGIMFVIAVENSKSSGGNGISMFFIYVAVWAIFNLLLYVDNIIDFTQNGHRKQHWLTRTFPIFFLIFLSFGYMLLSMMYAIYSVIVAGGNILMIWPAGFGTMLTQPFQILVVLSRSLTLRGTITEVTGALNTLEKQHFQRINQQIAYLAEIRRKLDIKCSNMKKHKLKLRFDAHLSTLVLHYLNSFSRDEADVISLIDSETSDNFITSNEEFSVTLRVNNEFQTAKMKFKYELNNKNVTLLVVETEDEVEPAFFQHLFANSLISEEKMTCPQRTYFEKVEYIRPRAKYVLDKLLGVTNDSSTFLHDKNTS